VQRWRWWVLAAEETQQRSDCAAVRFSRDDCAGVGGAEVVQSAEQVIVQWWRGAEVERCIGA
jgi:hypothetical protein